MWHYILIPILLTLNYSITLQIWDITDNNEEIEDSSIFAIFRCSYYKVIELIVIYDTIFYSWVEGSSNAWDKINQIVSIVSVKYQHDLCMSIKILALERHCN